MNRTLTAVAGGQDVIGVDGNAVHQQPAPNLQRVELAVGHAHIPPDEVFHPASGVLFMGYGGEGSVPGCSCTSFITLRPVSPTARINTMGHRNNRFYCEASLHKRSAA